MSMRLCARPSESGSGRSESPPSTWRWSGGIQCLNWHAVGSLRVRRRRRDASVHEVLDAALDHRLELAVWERTHIGLFPRVSTLRHLPIADRWLVRRLDYVTRRIRGHATATHSSRALPRGEECALRADPESFDWQLRVSSPCQACSVPRLTRRW